MFFSFKNSNPTNTKTNPTLVFLSKGPQTVTVPRIPHSVTRVPEISNNTNSVSGNGGLATKKPAWGQPTWFLFHTLAEKMDETMFPVLKNEFFNIIKIICFNLPCPLCADHAKEYLSKTNFNAILTKEHLKEFFFHFHNTVNLRKGYPVLKRDELDTKYQQAVTHRVIYHFLTHFRDKSKNIRLLSNELYRKMVMGQVTGWLNRNIRHFSE